MQAALADVAEDQHYAGHGAVPIADRRGAVVDRPLGAVPREQQRVMGEVDAASRAQRGQRRVRSRLTGLLVDDPEDLVERATRDLVCRVARQAGRCRVQRRDAAAQDRW